MSKRGWGLEMKASTFIIFTLITFFGSALSSIGTFLAIGRAFQNISYVALALSLKTLAGVVLSKKLSECIKTIGTKRALLLSQLFGLPVLLLLLFAFNSGSVMLVLFAVLISGLPSLTINILLSPILREISQNEHDFKRTQGLFQLLSGFGMLIAGAISPTLLDKIGISGLYLIDGLTFVIATLFIFFKVSDFNFAPSQGSVVAPVTLDEHHNNLKIGYSKKVFLTILSISSLFLVGLIPLVASSEHSLGYIFSNKTLESLWVIECLSGIVVGFLYLRFKSLRDSMIIHYLPLFSAIPVFISTLTGSVTLFYTSFFVFAVMWTYGLNRYRDDYIEFSKEFSGRVSNSAYFQTILNALRTASPLLIIFFIEVSTKFGFKNYSVFLLIVQLSAAFATFLALYYSHKKDYFWLKKFVSNIILIFSILSVVLMTGIIILKLKTHQKAEVDIWLEAFPKSALPHLVESDYIPLQSKLEFVRKTSLFKSMSIFNKDGNYIAGFGNQLTRCTEPLSVLDDSGSKWGEICFIPDQFVYIRILLLPLIIISAIMLFFGIWLSRVMKINTIKEQESLNLKLERSEIIDNISTQVSHDIRSPLAALEMISGSLNELHEDKRLIIRNSINRIRDISNTLVAKYGLHSEPSLNSHLVQKTSLSTTDSEKFVVTLLSPLIDSIITEKRIQYRNQIGIRIEFNYTKESYGLFALILPSEFKRVLSNLINNSVEALTQHEGVVELFLLTTKSSQIELMIKDNGKGIPHQILAKLGKRGETHGKEQGLGLGLYHAIETMRKFKGSLKIESVENQGTSIILTIPREDEPKWFVPSIALKKDQTVVVFDDDQSIHQIWKGRIDSLMHHEIKILNFSEPNELRKYYGKNFTDLDEAIFLMDYEIAGNPESGLDVIETLGIQNQSILITSRYEEKSIRERCEAIGVRLIPKTMSGFVPMEIVS